MQLVAGSAAALCLLGATFSAPAVAKGGYPRNPTLPATKAGRHLGSTPPSTLAAAKVPILLGNVAEAVETIGKRDYASSYGGLYVHEDQGAITVYMTDVAKGHALVRAATRAQAAAKRVKITVLRCKYSRKVLDSEADNLMNLGIQATRQRAAHATPTYATVSVNVDASGITATTTAAVGTTSFARAQSVPMKSVGPAPITVKHGPRQVRTSWRWNDTKPFIGGDVAIGLDWTRRSTAACTTGVAGEDNNGRDFIITAEHCFPPNAYVYGEGDYTPGNYGYREGHFIGTVGTTSDQFDSEVIDTGSYNGNGSASDEADQPQGTYYRVTSLAYSLNGQGVCQDGAVSYYEGHGVPCGIYVNNQDFRYPLQKDDGVWINVRGVQGHTNGSWGCDDGDSGGLVFTVTGQFDRQARGQISARSEGSNTVCDWVETRDILGALALHLNPHT